MAEIPRIPEEPALRTKEAADKLGKSPTTLDNWRRLKVPSPPEWWKNGRNWEWRLATLADGAARIVRDGLPPAPPNPNKDPARVANMRGIQRKGPDAAIVKRLMKFTKMSAVRTERQGTQDHYYLADEDGERFKAIFDGDNLLEFIDLR
jgi:hypothetical protein